MNCQPVLSTACVAYLTPEGRDLARAIHRFFDLEREFAEPYSLSNTRSMPWRLFETLHGDRPTREWWQRQWLADLDR